MPSLIKVILVKWFHVPVRLLTDNWLSSQVVGLYVSGCGQPCGFYFGWLTVVIISDIGM